MNDEMMQTLKIASREHIYEVWQRVKADDLDGLDDSDRLLAKILKEHEDEFFNQFETADITYDHEYDPETEVNPFMHIAMHRVVETQLRDRNPVEAFQFYNAMLRKKCARHDAVHFITCLLVPLVFGVLKNSTEFDLDRYTGLLKKYKNRNPDKIYDALEQEFDGE